MQARNIDLSTIDVGTCTSTLLGENENCIGPITDYVSTNSDWDGLTLRAFNECTYTDYTRTCDDGSTTHVCEAFYKIAGDRFTCDCSYSDLDNMTPSDANTCLEHISYIMYAEKELADNGCTINEIQRAEDCTNYLASEYPILEDVDSCYAKQGTITCSDGST